jgi:hypothetical protein
MATDSRYTEPARRGGRLRPLTFGDAFRQARSYGDDTFEFEGKTYTTKTAEEQGREIGARAAAGSGRGASAGRTARNRDTAPGRAEIPTGGSSKAPAEGAEGMSEAQRNAMNMLMAIPPARAAGQAVRGGLKAAEAAAAARRAAAAEKRVEPMMATGRVRETGRFRSGSPSLREAQREAAEEMAREPALKKGGKVKAYANGGSVRGGGCETRTKKTKYV